jgi:hypothetical protein
MASAHAKFNGELGVCIATSGPGAQGPEYPKAGNRLYCARLLQNEETPGDDQ